MVPPTFTWQPRKVDPLELVRVFSRKEVVVVVSDAWIFLLEDNLTVILWRCVLQKYILKIYIIYKAFKFCQVCFDINMYMSYICSTWFNTLNMIKTH